ncbi:MAG: hypothetical protein IJW05_13530, partial [Lentisphaeria bacterium]|nr:hypothetical protein [Lentisphaeria bacterium]
AGKNGREQESTVENGNQRSAILRAPRRKKLPELPVIPELPVFPVPQPIISECAHSFGSAGKNGREQESTVENGNQRSAILRTPRRIHRFCPFLSVFVRSPQPILCVCALPFGSAGNALQPEFWEYWEY